MVVEEVDLTVVVVVDSAAVVAASAADVTRAQMQAVH